MANGLSQNPFEPQTPPLGDLNPDAGDVDFTADASAQPKTDLAPTNGRYSMAQIQEAARQGGWPEELIPKTSAIAWHEGAQGALKPNRKASAAENAQLTGGQGLPEDSVGPWQINWADAGNRKLAQSLGYGREDLFDPVNNAHVAHELYNRAGGFSPWRLANEKYHQKYLPQANKVYQNTVNGSNGNGKLNADAGDVDFSGGQEPSPKTQQPGAQAAAVPPQPGAVSPSVPGVNADAGDIDLGGRPPSAAPVPPKGGYLPAASKPTPETITPESQPTPISSSFYGLGEPGVTEGVNYDAYAQQQVDRAFGPGRWDSLRGMAPQVRQQVVQNAVNFNKVQDFKAQAMGVGANAGYDDRTGRYYLDNPKAGTRQTFSTPDELSQAVQRQGEGNVVAAAQQRQAQRQYAIKQQQIRAAMARAQASPMAGLQAGVGGSQPGITAPPNAERNAPLRPIAGISQIAPSEATAIRSQIRNELSRNIADPSRMSTADRAQLESEVNQRAQSEIAQVNQARQQARNAQIRQAKIDPAKAVDILHGAFNLLPNNPLAVLPPAARTWAEEWTANTAGSWIGKAAGLVRDGMPAVAVARAFGAPDPLLEPIAKSLQSAADQIHDLTAVIDKHADRRTGSQMALNIATGATGNAPEMALIALGVPAWTAFGMGGYADARGENLPFAQSIAHGVKNASIGALYDLPLPAKLQALEGISGNLARVGVRMPTVGVGTMGIELATGAPLKDAAQLAAVNALASGVGEAAGIWGKTAEQIPYIRARATMKLRELLGEKRTSDPELLDRISTDYQARASKQNLQGMPDDELLDRIINEHAKRAAAEQPETTPVTQPKGPTEPTPLAPKPAMPAQGRGGASPAAQMFAQGATEPGPGLKGIDFVLRDVDGGEHVETRYVPEAQPEPKALDRIIDESALPPEARTVTKEHPATPPAEPSGPRAPESLDEVTAQMRSLVHGLGDRKVVAFTPETLKVYPLPSEQELQAAGLTAIHSSLSDNEIVFRSDAKFNDKPLSGAEVLRLERDGRLHELLGLPNGDTPNATVAAEVKNADGKRLAAYYIEPGREDAFKAEMQKQLAPYASADRPLQFNFGGRTLENQIVAERSTEAQRVAGGAQPPSAIQAGATTATTQGEVSEGTAKPQTVATAPATSTLATAETVHDKDGKPIGVIKNPEAVAEGAKPEIRALHPSDNQPREAGKFAERRGPDRLSNEEYQSNLRKAGIGSGTPAEQLGKMPPELSKAGVSSSISSVLDRYDNQGHEGRPWMTEDDVVAELRDAIEESDDPHAQKVADLIDQFYEDQRSHREEYGMRMDAGDAEGIIAAARNLAQPSSEEKARPLSETPRAEVEGAIAESQRRKNERVAKNVPLKESTTEVTREVPEKAVASKVAEPTAKPKSRAETGAARPAPELIKTWKDARVGDIVERDKKYVEVVGRDLREAQATKLAKEGEQVISQPGTKRFAIIKPTEYAPLVAEKEEPEPHKFSSTQVNIAAPSITKMIKAAQKKIKPVDLQPSAMGGESATGLETDYHVTVKYGVHSDKPDGVKKALEGEGPITAKFGKVDVFEGVEDGTADAVIVKIDSPDLHRLNKLIADNVEVTDTYPEYKPHLTLAYVKLGEGKKYREMDAGLEGVTIEFDGIVFSSKDHSTTEIPLGGKEHAVETGQESESREPKHIGVSPRTNVPTHGGEVREKESGQTGGRGGAEQRAEVEAAAEVAGAHEPSEVGESVDDEIRRRMGLDLAQIEAYSPEKSIEKVGKHWSYELLDRKPHQAIFDTKREAVEAATRYKQLKLEQYENPTGYYDLASLKAGESLKRMRELMASGKSEMDAARIANEEQEKESNAQRTEPIERPSGRVAKEKEGEPPPLARGVDALTAEALAALKKRSPALSEKYLRPKAVKISEMIVSGKPDEKFLKSKPVREVYDQVRSKTTAGKPSSEPPAEVAQPARAKTTTFTPSVKESLADWARQIHELPEKPSREELQRLLDVGKGLDIKEGSRYRRLLDGLESAIKRAEPAKAKETGTSPEKVLAVLNPTVREFAEKERIPLNDAGQLTTLPFHENRAVEFPASAFAFDIAKSDAPAVVAESLDPETPYRRIHDDWIKAAQKAGAGHITKMAAQYGYKKRGSYWIKPSEQTGLAEKPIYAGMKKPATPKAEKTNRAGFTKEQAAFIAKETEGYAHHLMVMAFGEEGAKNFIEKWKGEFPAASVVGNAGKPLEVAPKVIDVPDDGTFTVANAQQANRLHQRATGEPIEGFAKEKGARVFAGTPQSHKYPGRIPELDDLVAAFGGNEERTMDVLKRSLEFAGDDAQGRYEQEKLIDQLQERWNSRRDVAEVRAPFVDQVYRAISEHPSYAELRDDVVKNHARVYGKIDPDLKGQAEAYNPEQVITYQPSPEKGVVADRIRTAQQKIWNDTEIPRDYKRGDARPSYQRPTPAPIDWFRIEAEAKEGIGKFTPEPVGVLAGLNLRDKELPSEPVAEPEKEAVAKAEPAEKLTDVGENLWYNRRNFTGKAIQWDQVKDLNDTLKLKEVVKSKVWPRPNYQQLVNDGLQPFFAHFVKQVYDGIGNTPSGKTDEDLQRYISVVGRVKDAVFDWAKDSQSNKEFLTAVGEQAAKIAGAASGHRISTMDFLPKSDIQSAILNRVWSEEAEAPRYGRFSRGSEANADIRAIGGQRALKAMQFTVDDAVKALREIEAGWPNPQEAWQRRGYKVVKGENIKTDFHEGKRNDGTPYVSIATHMKGNYLGSEIIRGAESKDDLRVQKYLEEHQYEGKYLLLRKGKYLESAHDTEDEAKEAARAITKTKERGGRDLRGMNIGEAERKGPDRRQADEDITPERLMSEFGFRGVNFGREGWINQTERQVYLNHAYDALIDMAELIDVPPKALSLNGMLGLAFGAQGRGGSAAAHFVPGVNEINLTKTKGAGTLSHEWGHALDHYFATAGGLAKAGDPYLSEHIGQVSADGYIKREGKKVPLGDVRPEILAAFKAVSGAMNTRIMTPEEVKARTAALDAKSLEYLNSWIKFFRRAVDGFSTGDKAQTIGEFEQLANRLRAGDVGEGYIKVGQMRLPQVVGLIRLLLKDKTSGAGADAPSNWKALDSAANSIRYRKSRKEADKEHEPKLETTSTEYKSESVRKDQEKKGKQYWSTETEKFARAWETYVADKLAEQSQKNTFLSDAAIRAHMKLPDGTFVMPYPRGVDRKATNEAFAKLVSAIETKETDKGTALYAMGGEIGEEEPVGKFGEVKDNEVSLGSEPFGRELLADLLIKMKQLSARSIRGLYVRGDADETADNLEQMARVGRSGAGILGRAIREAGKVDQGRVVLYSSPASRRHELFHYHGDIASGGYKRLDERHTPEGLERLTSSEQWSILEPALLARGYRGDDAYLVEEAAATLTEGDRLGLTDEQRDRWMIDWYTSFRAAGGNISVADFKELTHDADRIRATVESRTPTRIIRAPSDRGPGPSGRLQSLSGRRGGGPEEVSQEADREVRSGTSPRTGERSTPSAREDEERGRREPDNLGVQREESGLGVGEDREQRSFSGELEDERQRQNADTGANRPTEGLPGEGQTDRGIQQGQRERLSGEEREPRRETDTRPDSGLLHVQPSSVDTRTDISDRGTAEDEFRHRSIEAEPQGARGEDVSLQGRSRDTGGARGPATPSVVRQTDTPEFRGWFGNSKVVDENGDPLVVYHGSGTKDIGVFDVAKAGTILRGDWGEGIYFTPSKWLADSYREDATVALDKEDARLWNEYEAAAKRMGTTPMNSAIDLGFQSPKYNELGEYEKRWRNNRTLVRKQVDLGQVYPAYLKLTNPLRQTAVGMNYTDPFLAERAKSKGHDGIIIEREDGSIDEIVAFRPEQIKSATGNRGTFDPSNPNILMSREAEPDPWTELKSLADVLDRLKRESGTAVTELERPEGSKIRSLPQTLEAADIPTEGAEKYYEPESVVGDGLTRARELINDKGIDGAIEFVRAGDGIEWASTGYEVLSRLRAQEQELRPTDAKAADAIAEKRLRFLDDFAVGAVERGRSIVGIKAVVEFAPDRASYMFNKASLRGRKRGISQEEEASFVVDANEYAAQQDRLKTLDRRVELWKETAHELEAELEAERAKRPSKTREPKEPGERKLTLKYEIKLDAQAKKAKDSLVDRYYQKGKFEFGNLLPSIPVKMGEKGAVGPNIESLPGDAELLAEYAAGQLAKFDTLAELNKHLMSTFGAELEPFLPAIIHRADQIRRNARTAELAEEETKPERRRTILQEIQKEIQDEATTIAAQEKAHVAAEKARKQSEETERKEAEKAIQSAATAQQKAEERKVRENARLKAKEARQQERTARLKLIEEARQRKNDARTEYKEAAQAETKAWRERIRAQRQAARTAALWDTPIRQQAAEARARFDARVVGADPNDPEVIDGLVSVAAENFLREKSGGPVGTRAIWPTKFYKEMKEEFPGIVTDKNKGEILKRAKQRIDDTTAAAREAARMRSASKASQEFWEKAGMDIDVQAVLIQKAEATRRAQEARQRMAAEIQRVSRPAWKRGLLAVKNLPRSLQTSLNMHQGRQGMFALLTHPIAVTGKIGIPQTLKGMTLWKREDFLRAAEELRSHRHFDLFVKAGGQVAELPDDTGEAGLTMEEDILQSPLAMRLPHVRLSTQGFILGMNSERLGLFSLWASAGEANGYTWDSNPRFFQQAAEAANDASGRSTMPKALQTYMGLANELFYATRLNFSRVMLLNDLFNPFRYLPPNWNPLDSGFGGGRGGGGRVPPIGIGGAGRGLPPEPPGRFDSYDPIMRKIMLGNLLRIASAMAVLLLTAKLLGFHFYTDPDDPDTWKLVWRNHHTDLSGGSASTLKFAYRFTRSVGRFMQGEAMPENELPWWLAWRFLRTKTAPWPTAVIDYFAKKNVVGEPANLKVDLSHPQKTMEDNIILRMLLPISVEDTVKAFVEDGWQDGVPAMGLQFLGFETQTYARRPARSDAEQFLSRQLNIRRGPMPDRTEEEEDNSKLRHDLQDRLRTLHESVREQVQGENPGMSQPAIKAKADDRYWQMMQTSPDAKQLAPPNTKDRVDAWQQNVDQWLTAQERSERDAITKEIVENTKAGKLKPSAPQSIAKGATESKLQSYMSYAEIRDALDAYENHMTPEERAETKDILVSKGSSIKSLPLTEQAAVRAQFQKVTGQAPLDREPHLRNPQWIPKGALKPSASPTAP